LPVSVHDVTLRIGHAQDSFDPAVEHLYIERVLGSAHGLDDDVRRRDRHFRG
jgi:hypothetical protein